MDISILSAIVQGAGTSMTEVQFLEKELQAWKVSPIRLTQIRADEYYAGEHDILKRKRQAIGRNGELVDVENLPNNKIIDNQYAKAVDQKTNYLFSKAFTVETKDKTYADLLNEIFDNRFRRQIKRVGKGSINGGIAWLHPYYDGNVLKYKMFNSWEVLPFWKDAEHTELDAAIRLYTVEGYEGEKEVTIEKVEYYHKDGIDRYVLDGTKLIPDVENPSSAHFQVKQTVVKAGQPTDTTVNMVWERIPLIPFKFDDNETPLIKRVKSLQDALNLIDSNFVNGMEQSPYNTILVIENYDGENLGEMRHNLALYGAIKVSSTEGAKGGVTTLEIKVDSTNYETIRKTLKGALIENARALDVKSDQLGGNPNEMNIQSMYADLDLDANGMELEFQAAFEDLLFFINADLANKKLGDFTKAKVDILFNRDLMISESSTITNLKNSVGMISDETIIANHPLVKDKDEEMGRLKAEKTEKMAMMSEDPFEKKTDEDPEDDVNE